jgi:protein TonB
LTAQLAQIFLNAQQEGFHGVEATRYPDEKSAGSSASIFRAMIFRRSQVPLYELRFTQGNRFKSVFAFAYVDGAFRIVLVPDFSKPTAPPPSRADASKTNAAEPGRALRMGAAVQAARVVCKVAPYYPMGARMAYISGTVRLHAIIGKDGSVKQLEAVSGPDELIASAKAAVSQWRYRPILVNGEPVEVDTTIDVIYSLNH